VQVYLPEYKYLASPAGVALRPSFGVEIVILEKLNCILSKRATRPYI
jgi:hypothetical protein